MRFAWLTVALILVGSACGGDDGGGVSTTTAAPTATTVVEPLDVTLASSALEVPASAGASVAATLSISYTNRTDAALTGVRLELLGRGFGTVDSGTAKFNQAESTARQSSVFDAPDVPSGATVTTTVDLTVAEPGSVSITATVSAGGVSGTSEPLTITAT